jgi:hypothetical protein
LKKKNQKNFVYSRARALAAPTPRAEIKKSFLLLFLKKEVLSLPEL